MRTDDQTWAAIDAETERQRLQAQGKRQREIAEEHGFELVDHALVLYVRPKGSKVTRQEGAGPGKK